jgi:hypothetical protein
MVGGIKRPGSKTGQSPPSVVEGQEWWSYTSIFPHFFMVWCLIIKHEDKFTLSLDAVELCRLEFSTQRVSGRNKDYAELLVTRFYC